MCEREKEDKISILEKMKETSKRIWVSKMTILITIVQLIVPLLGGLPFFCMSFWMSIIINVLAMVLINYNINWLNKNDRNDEAEGYWKEAPCIFQAIKFSFGIILSAFIILFYYVFDIKWIDMEKIIHTWFFVPLLLFFVTITFMNSGLYDNIPIKEKIKKLPLIPKIFCLCMFDYSKDKKIIFTFRSILSTIALVILVIVVVGYYLMK